MKRFGLLGRKQGESKRQEESPEMEMPKITDEEREFARAKQDRLDRMSQYSNLFARIGEGNNPPPSNEKMVEPDDEILLSGLMGTYDY